MIVSNCCGASYAEPGHPDNDICGACGEHSDAINQDEPSINVIEMPALEVNKEDFDAFEDIRTYGAWNMFDPRAIEASGLERKVYLAVMSEYSELKEKYYGKIDESAGISDRA